MSSIIHVPGRQIYDSRGNATVEVDVMLDDGSFGPLCDQCDSEREREWKEKEEQREKEKQVAAESPDKRVLPESESKDEKEQDQIKRRKT